MNEYILYIFFVFVFYRQEYDFMRMLIYSSDVSLTFVEVETMVCYPEEHTDTPHPYDDRTPNEL